MLLLTHDVHLIKAMYTKLLSELHEAVRATGSGQSASSV